MLKRGAPARTRRVAARGSGDQDGEGVLAGEM